MKLKCARSIKHPMCFHYASINEPLPDDLSEEYNTERPKRPNPLYGKSTYPSRLHMAPSSRPTQHHRRHAGRASTAGRNLSRLCPQRPPPAISHSRSTLDGSKETKANLTLTIFPPTAWRSAQTKLGAAFGLSSCNVTRTVTTKSEYWQKADTSVVIQTKTIETYDASKKLY